MDDKKELEEEFNNLFSSDFVELYSEIKDYLHINSFDLLNEETKNSIDDFVKLIFNNVKFEKNDDLLEENDDYEEFIESY
tara:strand:+ start:746 stop:985 length:240 start_codon:yes stop_codon:yes gene_type:complete